VSEPHRENPVSPERAYQRELETRDQRGQLQDHLVRVQGCGKILIFSTCPGYVDFLIRIIREHTTLRVHGYHGKSSDKTRKTLLERLKLPRGSSDWLDVLVMTYKTGGEGLNMYVHTFLTILACLVD
jgi:hypothetical protein